jgi:hypothetical protein
MLTSHISSDQLDMFSIKKNVEDKIRENKDTFILQEILEYIGTTDPKVLSSTLQLDIKKITKIDFSHTLIRQHTTH